MMNTCGDLLSLYIKTTENKNKRGGKTLKSWETLRGEGHKTNMSFEKSRRRKGLT